MMFRIETSYSFFVMYQTNLSMDNIKGELLLNYERDYVMIFVQAL